MYCGAFRVAEHGSQIRILDGISGAARATGLAVIIDVFRAFTVTPWLFHQGAARVIPVATEAQARAEKWDDPTVLLAGERNGRRLAGFDLGNSPAEVAQTSLSGKTVIQRTSAGTQGLMAATGADRVLTASFVNAAAVTGTIVNCIRSGEVGDVCLVAMGWNGVEASIEDRLCAEYLSELAAGGEPVFSDVRECILADPGVARFSDPEQPWFPAADVDYCLQLDRFDVVVELDRSNRARPELFCRRGGEFA